MGLPSLDILSPEKLARLEAMTETMKDVAATMERASEKAQEAAEAMAIAAEAMNGEDV